MVWSITSCQQWVTGRGLLYFSLKYHGLNLGDYFFLKSKRRFRGIKRVVREGICNLILLAFTILDGKCVIEKTSCPSTYS